MTRFNLSRWIVVATALVVSLYINCNRAASAVIVNVLAGVHDTSVADGFPIEGQNADPTLDFTDGSTTTGLYFLYNPASTPPGTATVQGSITYNLGTPTVVDLFGFYDGNDPGRNHPTSMEIDFSNDNFANISATRIVPLADVNYQQVAFAGVAAEYVRFVTPLGRGAYYTDRGDQAFTTIEELELYHVPEPASLGLLGVGGLVLLKRRRV